jgi:thiamine pyrophosphate-dependent acetolactate synthase large subunit-like protein
LIRVVDFRKAVIAGVAGAAAMEVVLRGFALVGLPVFDLVEELGAVVFHHSHLLGWAGGLGAHAFVGIM